jgi:hypothetical protein
VDARCRQSLRGSLGLCHQVVLIGATFAASYLRALLCVPLPWVESVKTWPTDTEVFLALLQLLDRHEIPGLGRIASCRRQIDGDRAVYWVRSSRNATGAVGQALAEFFKRPMPPHGTWVLSLEDAERITEWGRYTVSR